MRLRILCFALLFFSLRCSVNNGNRKEIELLSVKSIFLRPSPKEDYFSDDSTGKIIRKERNGDTLAIAFELTSSGHSRFDGNIKVEGYSLFLFYWHINDTATATLERYEIYYKILNHQNKGFKVATKYIKRRETL